MNKKINLRKYINKIICGASVLLLAACTVTPEAVERAELKPAVTTIAAPVISDVTVNNNADSPSITVVWEPVDKATFYLFEYESANDYLSHGENEYKSFITNSNSYTFTSEYFSDSSDMRYVFRVKAASKSDTTGSILYSSASGLKEATILNSFTLSPVLQNNVLTIYTAFPKLKSVLGSGSIVQPEVKFYDGDYVGGGELPEALSDNSITLSSAEEKTITGVLFVDGEEILRKKVNVKNAVDYYPPAMLSISGSANEDGYIELNWSAKALNKGLEDYKPVIRFYIERTVAGENSWTRLTDSSSNPLYIDGKLESGDYSYRDETAKPGVEYKYRVLSEYSLTFQDASGDVTVTFEEDKSNALISDICYVQDKEVKSFTIRPVSGFTGEPVRDGDATYVVDLNWESFHSLPEGVNYKVTRWDFDKISFVDGNPTDESTADKFEVVYEGSNTSWTDTFVLSAEKNMHAINYTYYIQISGTDNPMTQAKMDNGSGSLVDGIVTTNPSVTAISYINTLTATKDDEALSDKIVLNWTLNESEIAAAGLDVSKVYVHVLKKVSTDPSYADLHKDAKGITGNSYEDKDVKAGENYSYILRPYYDDEASVYNGIQSAESEKQAVGNILKSVSVISASINTSNSEISVSWDSVEHSHGYDVYYRAKGDSAWTKALEATKENQCTLKDGLVAGKRYEITASAIDNEGKSNPDASAIAEGEILGNIKATATGDVDIEANTIKVTWNPVENATAYEVAVYDDENNSFYSETIRKGSNCEYVLSADSEAIKAYSAEHKYALSRKYSFTVTPIVNNVRPAEAAEKVTGYWIMPPKNIKTTKAEYKDQIVIRWNGEAFATNYKVYYRMVNSNSAWKLIGASGNSLSVDHLISDNEFYEYSVSSVINGVEGPIQSYFDSTVLDGEKDNIGYILMTPSLFHAKDLSNQSTGESLVLFDFGEVKGATAYQIRVNSQINDTFTHLLKVSDIQKEEPSVKTAGIAYIKNGTIYYYLPRMDAINNPYNTASITARKGDSFENKSQPSTCDYKPSYLTKHEIVNFVNKALNNVFVKADSQFAGDWWMTSSQTYNDGFAVINNSSDFFTQKRGTATFTEYSYNSIELNTYISSAEDKLTVYARDGGTLGSSLGTDPLDTITGVLKVGLPYDFGTVYVKYDNYKVDNSGGSVFVSNSTTFSDSDSVAIENISSVVLKK